MKRALIHNANLSAFNEFLSRVSAMTSTAHTDLQNTQLVFIGGGNMASAILGGLLKQGLAPSQVCVVEPFAEAAAKLTADFGVTVHTAATDALAKANVVIWAVKPQVFKEAAMPVAPFTTQALHLSVAAGIRSDSIAHWLKTERVVRSMPNTPALVGQGITGLYAREGVTAKDQQLITQVLKSTGHSPVGFRPRLRVLFLRSHDRSRRQNGLATCAGLSLGPGHIWRRHALGTSVVRVARSLASTRDLQRRNHLCSADQHGQCTGERVVHCGHVGGSETRG
jgi:hypothetical protein